jgi:hypothetical protein
MSGHEDDRFHRPGHGEAGPSLAAGAPETTTPPASPPGTSRTVKLLSGGTLTISATLDLFALSSGDRSFVFKLIDELEDYESRVKKVESEDDEEKPKPKRTKADERETEGEGRTPSNP